VWLRWPIFGFLAGLGAPPEPGARRGAGIEAVLPSKPVLYVFQAMTDFTCRVENAGSSRMIV
jgi:hypothetical protein